MPTLTAAEVQQILAGADGSGRLGPFSDVVLHGVTVVSCEPERLVVRLPVTERITNSSANLHGGASCTLTDVLTTAALLIADQRMSVTIDLHMTCVSAAPLGDLLECVAAVEQRGKSVLFSSCRIFALGQDGERRLVAIGLHTKKVVGFKAAPASKL